MLKKWQGYLATRESNRGKAHYIQSIGEECKGFGTLTQMFKADDYRNKRMRFAAVVKSERVAIWTGLWMRIDGPEDGKALGFDNMLNRPIQGTTDWQKCEVVLDVPQESVYVAFGILLAGPGRAWLSDVSFEEVGTAVPVTAPRGESPTDVRVASFQGCPDHPGNLDFARVPEHVPERNPLWQPLKSFRLPLGRAVLHDARSVAARDHIELFRPPGERESCLVFDSDGATEALCWTRAVTCIDIPARITLRNTCA